MPSNLSAHFGNSERFKRYRAPQPRPEEQKAVMTGVKRIATPVASDILIDGRLCGNTQGSYLHASAESNKGGVGGQEQNGKQEARKLHSCYSQSQISRITKFICWSHGPTGGYSPEIALLFKELPYITAKFKWRQSPNATVFMYNDNGGVDKLHFGDSVISGLECVYLGEPVGNYTAAPGDTSTFISLIPGSDRADQIFDTLMDKDAKEIQRPQWDDGSAIISSSQGTDDGYLMMKCNQKLRNNRYAHLTDLSDMSAKFKTPTELSDKQITKTKASSRAESILHPTNASHRTLAWLPSKIPNQMANKITSFFPGVLSKPAKDFQSRGPLPPTSAVVAPASAPINITGTPALKRHVYEPNKFRRVYERVPRLPRAYPSHTLLEKHNSLIPIENPNLNTAMNHAGNNIFAGPHDENLYGKIFVEKTEDCGEPGESVKPGGDIRIPRFTTDGQSSAYGFVVDNKGVLVTEDELEVSKTMHGTSYHKSSFLSQELYAPGSGLRTFDGAYVLGGKEPVSPPNFHTSKFDLGGLPRTYVRVGDLSACINPPLPMTPPDTPIDDHPFANDPVFKDCKIQRGFDPIYPNNLTPKAEFQNRVGGLENWYRFPMVQIAREYLPEAMKDTDWSWTDNDVSGEFIPGGIAW